MEVSLQLNEPNSNDSAYPLVSSLQQPINEIWPLLSDLHTPLQFIRRHGVMLGMLLEDPLRNHPEQELHQ